MQQINQTNLLQKASFINGELWQQTTDSSFLVTDKATGEAIFTVFDGGVQAANAAIECANASLKSWQKLGAHQRAELLWRWHDLILQNQADLARIMTLEQGKPLAESQAEIKYGASFIAWFAEEGKRLYGDIIPAVNPSQRIWVTKQGIGVVTAITPWNFPSAMITRKAAAALAAGCTFVVRPDDKTPLSALALAFLAKQAGIPNGVFNVVIGQNAQAIGEVLTTHADVAKFTFTGSTRVGKILNQQCASGLKKVSLELGGNAPFIIFADANIEQAISGLLASKFRNAGQTCVCSNRIFVERSIYQTVCEQLAERMKSLKVGHGLDENIDIGPLISTQAVLNCEQLIQKAVSCGAKLKLGGQRADKTAHFLQPTLLTEVTADMPICQHELFAPIVLLIAFDDEAQVVDMANNTEAGLAAYCYTENLARAIRMSEALDYGMVGINEGIISTAVAPFGGVKQSGFGREGSKYGLDDYITLKYTCIGGI